jgi:hypothetical protein
LSYSLTQSFNRTLGEVSLIPTHLYPAIDLAVRIFRYDVEEEYYWAEPSCVARRALEDKKRAERGKNFLH